MARHEAPDGAASHPLVDEALRLRSGEHGAHRERSELPGTEGPVGWPGAEPDEGGEPVGWPGGSSGGPRVEHPVQDDGPAAPAEPAPSSSDGPRGWRRLFGRSRAA